MQYRGSDKEALQMLIDHELAISDLYATYANFHVDHREYWQSLAKEEREHADTIKRLLDIIDSGKQIINTANFKPIAVKTSIDYLRQSAARARSATIPLPEALSTALDVEKAMIERKFFGIFDTASSEAQAVRKVLEDGTHSHVAKLESEWHKYRH
ncbi:MAG: hypothetical protein AB1483_06540 [Candidatus Zixiibacteriota bacterium]